MIALFFIGAIITCTTASIQSLDDFILHNASVLCGYEYMSRRTLEDDASFIELQTTVSRANSMWDGFGNIEAIIYPKDLRTSITEYGSLCCDAEGVRRGVCSKEQSFFIPQNATIPFAYKQLSFQGEKETLSVHLNADTDGLYYYCVGSCQVNVTNVRLNTILTTYNPHGFLSATSYGELPFSLFLLVYSSGLLAYWSYHMIVTSSSSSFHRRIAFCLFVFVLRSLLLLITCIRLNRHGSVDSKTRCFAEILHSLSQGLLLEVLFHVLWRFVYNRYI